jgi:hypothetical protein
MVLHIFVSFEGKIGYDNWERFKQTHCNFFRILAKELKQKKT